MTKEAARPLAGVRVIDFGHYIAGPLAGMMLADQGAEVIRITRPGRSGSSPLDEALDRGKFVIPLDLKDTADRANALRLMSSADVILENFRPGVMDRLGLGASVVRQSNPSAIYVSLPGFSKTDKARAGLQAWEGLLGAATGLHTDISLFRNVLGLPPVFSALPLPSVYGAIHAAIAVAAALVARRRTGLGDTIEVPLADAAMSAMAGVLFEIEKQPRRYDAPMVPKIVRHTVLPLLRAINKRSSASRQRRVLEKASRLLPPLFRSYRCSDGKLLFVNALDHSRQSRAILSALGLLDEFLEQGLELGNPYESSGGKNNLNNMGLLSNEWKKRLTKRIGEVLASRPAEEWETLLQKAGVPAGVHRTTEQWMDLAPLRASGISIDNPSERYDLVRQPGPIVSVNENDVASIGKSARPLNVADAIAAWKSREVVPRGTKENGGFLSGVRVLDLSNVIAGPAASRTLAEYGADVIKLDGPDPQIGPRMSIWFGVEVGQGKRSLIVDLKTNEGQAILGKLVRRADIVLHNYLDDAAERLGITHRQLRVHRPDIISVQISAYGGPHPGGWASHPAFDPVIQASSGIQTRFGDKGRPQLHAIASCIDYLTGYAAAFGAIVALMRRGRNGEGAEVRTSLARATGFVQLPFAVSTPATEVSVGPSGQDAVGPSAAHRIFRTANGWVFVASDTRDDRALSRLLETTGARQAGSLEAAFRTRTTDHWLKKLGKDNIAAHAVLSLADIRAHYRLDFDPNAKVDTLHGPYRVIRHAHPSGHRVSLMAPTWVRASENPLRRLDPAVRYGLHSREIVAELGYTTDAIERLVSNQVIADGWRGISQYLPK